MIRFSSRFAAATPRDGLPLLAQAEQLVELRIERLHGTRIGESPLFSDSPRSSMCIIVVLS